MVEQRHREKVGRPSPRWRQVLLAEWAGDFVPFEAVGR